MKARAMMRVAAAPATRLGVARAVLGAYTLWYLATQRGALRTLAESDPELFAPVGPVRVLGKPLPASVAHKVIDGTLASTALFTLGVGHRWTGPLHSALLTWTLSYRNSWSMIFHEENSMVWHSLILGASRATDAFSLDALRRHHVGADEPHARYGWPLRTMQAASSATYLLAGIAKLRGSAGLSWASGEQLRRQVTVDRIRKDLYGSPQGAVVARALYPRRQLFTAFAVGSLALELGAPLALAHPKAGRWWALSTFGMHWGIRAIMGIKFWYQLSGAAFASWFDIEKLANLILLRRR